MLQVVLSLGPGGTERLVIDMTKHLRQHAHVAVCCLDEPGGWANELTDIGVPLETMGRQPGFHPSLARRIARMAKEHRANVMHCHHYSPFVYGVLAGMMCSSRVVYTEHGRLSDAPPSPKRKLANKVFARLPGKIFAVSHDLREHMIGEGFPASRVGVVHNGIRPQPKLTPQSKADARKLLDLPDGPFVFGTVARLDPVKDLTNLISALKRVDNAMLVIVGDGDERNNLEEAAANANVRFTGRRDDVRNLLPAFDVYVNCSITEGISVTILEAMATGLPVIATRVGGTPEVVIDGETGLLVPSRDSDALANAMKGMLANTGTYGPAGRSRVECNFTMKKMVDQYVQAYGM